MRAGYKLGPVGPRTHHCSAQAGVRGKSPSYQGVVQAKGMSTPFKRTKPIWEWCYYRHGKCACTMQLMQAPRPRASQQDLCEANRQA